MKRLIFLFVIIMPAVQRLPAQDVFKIARISSALNTVSGVDRVDLYNELAWEYRKSHPDSMLFYANKAIELVKKLKLKGHLAQPYNYIGIAYQYMGHPVKSFDYYHLAMEEAIKHSDSIQHAHSLNSLGRLFFTQGDFVKAYGYYQIALNIFKKIDNKAGLSYCYKSLSEIYQTQNDDVKALDMLEKAYKIRLESNNVPGQISLLIDLAQIQERNENYNKSFDYYLKAKIKAEGLNDVINIANTDIGIAHLYYLQERYADALIFAKKALKMAGNTGNMRLATRILVDLGRIYFNEGEYEKAKDYFNEVLKNSKRLKSLELQQHAYYYLSEICEIKGNTRCAYNNFQQYAEVRKTLNNDEVARSIAKLESRLEIEKRERENEILQATQVSNELLIDRQRYYNIALAVAIIAVLLLVINILITNNRRRESKEQWQRKKAYIAEQQEEIKAKNEMIFYQNQVLQKHNEDLGELNNEKDTLMNIVAHDLKSPFNRIQGISELLQLSGLNEEQHYYTTLLNKIAKGGVNLIRDLLEVNAFEGDVRKPNLSKVNVHELLAEKIQGFNDDAALKSITLQLQQQDVKLDIYSDEIYLSRILDNLISNAIKFSTPGKSVVLDYGRMEEGTFISVKDFGQGFTAEDKKNIYKKFTKLSAQPTAGETSNGLGLAIVKIMVNRLGADIQLESEVGKGSKFIIKFPLRKESGIADT